MLNVSSQTVYTWTCDQNAAVEVTDSPNLPAGWLQVNVDNQYGNQMGADLCQTCAAQFQAALSTFKAAVT